MATSDPAQKVQDPEYKNWLRVGLALCYLKDGIVSLVQGEVDAMHQSLLHKLYGGTVPFQQCTSCQHENVKRIRGIWKMCPICPSGVCDSWLRELLELHSKRETERIYPENCDVRAWPFTPWECAKLYMPRGQPTTNTGPAHCDTQAILNLMTNCKRIHEKLSSQGQILIQRVLTIRNNLMHSEDMKITDSAREQCIQEIIKLLTDPRHLQALKACQNAVADIHKINNASVDVFFDLDLEMKALRECVKDVKQQLGVHRDKDEETTDALKEEFRKYQNELNNFKEKTREDIENVRRDVEKIDTKLQDHMHMIGTAVTQLLELGGTASAGQANIPEIVGLLCSRYDDMGGRSTGVCGGTGIPDRRPLSEGLKQLKYRTEDDLDTTMKQLGFIATMQAVKADKLLQKNNCLVIKGNPGEGKTTTALHLIDKDKFSNRRVVIKSLDDWKLVDTDWVDIVVLEDIFGRFDLDPGLQQGWMIYLQNIQDHIDAGKLEVIITTRTDVLAKATDLVTLPFLSDEFSLTLSSDSLEYSEKLGILNRELKKRTKILEDHEKEKCISNFQGLLGFPQCCALFAGDETLFREGARYFKAPEKMFYENIKHLKSGFLSLAFLFCLGEISEEFLLHDKMPEPNKNLLLELFASLKFHFTISEKDISVKLLRDSYELYTGVYVAQSNLCIHFSHATVYEAVGCVLGELCPEILIKYCSSEFLHQKVYAAKSRDKSSLKVYVPVPVYGCLAERIMKEVTEERHVQIVMEHSALKQQQFWKMLRKQCLQCHNIREFLTNELKSLQGQSNQVGSDGKVRTFLQCTLKKDVNIAMFAFDHLSEFLECSHKNNTIVCWKCTEKQNLLEISIYYSHFDIADKMLKMNGELSRISLLNAARHGNLKWVKSTIENLKQKKAFSPNERTLRESLCGAYRSGNQDVIECLLKEGIIMDLQCIGHVANNGNASSLAKVIAHLRKYARWEPASYDASRALLNAFLDQKIDIRDILVTEGISLKMEDLPSVQIQPSVLKSLIQHLQNKKNWDPNSPHASQILQLGYLLEMEDTIDLLIQKGVVLTMKDLCDLDKMKSSKYVGRVICHLKDTCNWDCKSLFASSALKHAYLFEYCDVIDLLHKEGVSLTIEHLPELLLKVSPKYTKMIIQHLKDTNQWDTKSNHVTETLIKAYVSGKNNVLDLLHQEGVTSYIDILHPLITSFSSGSSDEVFQSFFKPLLNSSLLAMLNLKGDLLNQKDASGLTMEKLPNEVVLGSSKKDTEGDLLNQKDASGLTMDKHLEEFVLGSSKKDTEKYVIEHLNQEGVSFSAWDLIVAVLMESSELATKVIKHLKNTNQWDANLLVCIPLLFAYFTENDDLIDMLHNEGGSLTIELLPALFLTKSSKNCKKEIQHLKDRNQWNPKSSLVSLMLYWICFQEKDDVLKLLQQEGISCLVEYLQYSVIFGSLKSAARLIQHFKDVNQWDPKSPVILDALFYACLQEKNHMIDLLHQEGVFLTMEFLSSLVILGSSKHLSKVIQHLKGTNQWNPRSHLASDALHVAFLLQKSDVIDLFHTEGIFPTMEMLPGENALVSSKEDTSKCDVNDLLHQVRSSLTKECMPTVVFTGSSSHVIKVIEILKNINRWDPKSSYASNTLLLAIFKERNDVIDVLQQEGVSLTMQHVWVSVTNGSSKLVSKVIQYMKDTNQWDPRSDFASLLLCAAYSQVKNDVIDVLHQEGVFIKYIHLCTFTNWDSEVGKREIQHLKDIKQWNSKLSWAPFVLTTVSLEEQNDLTDLLYQEDGSLDLMMVLGTLLFSSPEHAIKLIQFVQNTDRWDPNSLDACMILLSAHLKKNNFNIDLLHMEVETIGPLIEIMSKIILSK